MAAVLHFLAVVPLTVVPVDGPVVLVGRFYLFVSLSGCVYLYTLHSRGGPAEDHATR